MTGFGEPGKGTQMKRASTGITAEQRPSSTFSGSRLASTKGISEQSRPKGEQFHFSNQIADSVKMMRLGARCCPNFVF